MIEFTMEEAASIRLSTHQSKLEKYEARHRPKSQHFQDVSLGNMDYLLRRAFRISVPPIESAGQTRLTVDQTGVCAIYCTAHDGWDVTGCQGLFCPVKKASCDR